MVRCLPVSSYKLACSIIICIVFLLVIIFFSGLHFFMNICVSGMVVGGGDES